jgi:hypothetical protein
MAKIRLNGKEVGTRWHAPYQVEITDEVVEGENKLEVEVANLWCNRLIGDANQPENKRLTWSTWKNPYPANSPLYPSGLIGPVQILTENKDRR